VDNDAIGKIITIKASLTFKAPEDEDNRYFNPELGGGSLLDLGVYPVFLCLLLLGKPAAIRAIARLSPEGVDETCAVLFGYDGGETAVIDSSFITETDAVAEILGEKGAIKILTPWNEKPDGIQVTLYSDDPKKEKDITEYPCEWEGRGFQFEVEEVLNCLRNKQIESNLLCHHFSLDLMETMDEIRKQIHVKYEKYE
jgi:predicted dehydrogenase